MKAALVIIRVIVKPRERCQERFLVRGKAPEHCLNRAVYAVTFVDPGCYKRRVKVCHKHLDIYLKLRFMACDKPYIGKGDYYD